MKQINQHKYRQGVKLVAPLMVKRTDFPMINIELRRIGFDDQDLELFWGSTIELRSFKSLYEGEQKRIHQMTWPWEWDDTEEYAGANLP